MIIKSDFLLQTIIITAGVFAGAYLSNLSYRNHDHLHNADLNKHRCIPHPFIEVGNDSIIPGIEKLKIFKDPVSGWNLFVQTKEFQFRPENVSKKHIQGEGHAHLMINGIKIARLYSNWFHIPELKDKENLIEVTLNANSHAIMTINDIPICKKINPHNFIIN